MLQSGMRKNNSQFSRKWKKKQIPENSANILQFSGLGKMLQLQSGMLKNILQFSGNWRKNKFRKIAQTFYNSPVCTGPVENMLQSGMWKNNLQLSGTFTNRRIMRTFYNSPENVAIRNVKKHFITLRKLAGPQFVAHLVAMSLWMMPNLCKCRTALIIWMLMEHKSWVRNVVSRVIEKPEEDVFVTTENLWFSFSFSLFYFPEF
jgi:hypothetical protein